MPQVALTTIRERVRQMCDLPAFDTESPVTAAAVLDFITSAAALLAALVKERAAELYFTTTADGTTQVGIPTVSLPQNLSELFRISWEKSASESLGLEIANVDEFIAYPNAWGGQRPKYRIVGQAVEFFPTPDAAYTLKFYYSTGLYPTAIGDQLALRDGWDQWIVAQTAIFCRTRQGKDASEFERALAALTDTVKRGLRRDRAGVRQVRDVRGTSDRLPRHGRWW